MSVPNVQLDLPRWNPANKKKQGFTESWIFRIHPFKKTDQSKGAFNSYALSLRFHLLVSENGFRNASEVWAVFSKRVGKSAVSKIALKQMQGIDAFRSEANGTVAIGDSFFNSHTTQGRVQAKGHLIEWNLKIKNTGSSPLDHIPELLNRWRITQYLGVTLSQNLDFDGTVMVDGENFEWTAARGMQAHQAGMHLGYSWAWAYAGRMEDDQGRDSDFLFEALTFRPRILGRLPGPKISSFFFNYRGEAFKFNKIWESIRAQSRYELGGWKFKVDRGDLSFRGEVSADLKDFAGLTFEDTNGSVIHCASSNVSLAKIQVFRHGKLEASYTAVGNVSYEVASRTKNRYVSASI